MTPEQALAEVGSLTDGARVVAELPGGPASHNYLLERGEERWALRIDTQTAAALGLDRSAEAFILGHVHRAQLGPRLEFLDVEQGILLTRYVPGRAWTQDDLADDDNVARLAALLRAVHDLQIPAKPFGLRERVARYAACVGTPPAAERAHAIDALVTRLDATEACLCHNDVVCANVIAGDRLILVDWEYGALGDPFFDLATVVQHHGLSAETARVLLEAYFGRVREPDERRLGRWCEVYRCLVALWQDALDSLGGA